MYVYQATVILRKQSIQGQSLAICVMLNIALGQSLAICVMLNIVLGQSLAICVILNIAQ